MTPPRPNRAHCTPLVAKRSSEPQVGWEKGTNPQDTCPPTPTHPPTRPGESQAAPCNVKQPGRRSRHHGRGPCMYGLERMLAHRDDSPAGAMLRRHAGGTFSRDSSKRRHAWQRGGRPQKGAGSGPKMARPQPKMHGHGPNVASRPAAAPNGSTKGWDLPVLARTRIERQCNAVGSSTDRSHTVARRLAAAVRTASPASSRPASLSVSTQPRSVDRQRWSGAVRGIGLCGGRGCAGWGLCGGCCAWRAPHPDQPAEHAAGEEVDQQPR